MIRYLVIIAVLLAAVQYSPGAWKKKEIHHRAREKKEDRAPSRVELAENARPPEPGKSFTLVTGEDTEIEFEWIDAIGLWVSRYEITNAQFEMYDMAHESKPYYQRKIDRDEQPVVNVSWYEARNFCGWLNRNFSAGIPHDFRFRLPFESEWEAFASCGSDREYPWGNEWPPPDRLNYRGQEGSSFLFKRVEHNNMIQGHRDKHIVGAPVEESGVNDWGLFGVGGNVWEWCEDNFEPGNNAKVLKGGGWNTYWPENLRVESRSDCPPEESNPMIGFRAVLAPADVSGKRP